MLQDGKGEHRTQPTLSLFHMQQTTSLYAFTVCLHAWAQGCYSNSDVSSFYLEAAIVKVNDALPNGLHWCERCKVTCAGRCGWDKLIGVQFKLVGAVLCEAAVSPVTVPTHTHTHTHVLSHPHTFKFQPHTHAVTNWGSLSVSPHLESN